jgi:hypothetical protein
MRRKEGPGATAGARRNSNADEKSASNNESAPATQAPSVYVLRLCSLRGDDIRRLRLLLKRLLRDHGLRCVSIEPEAQP